MAENFLRRYVLRCGPSGGEGFEIGNISSAKEEALHISFSIEKSDTESNNTAKVQIWNLSDESLTVFDGADCICELKAGYGDTMALILCGTVTAVTTTLDGADRMTELEVVDGRVELRDTIMSVSLNGTVDTKEVYDKIAGEMGVSIVYAEDLQFPTLPNGYSFIGKGKNALQKITKYCGHEWTMQNQILQITNPGKPLTTMGYVLSADTGLINIPKKITLGSKSDSKNDSGSGSGATADTGWEVEYLLNGAIGINDTVILESKMASGYFRVYKLTIDGDNMEGDWICTAQLIALGA